MKKRIDNGDYPNTEGANGITFCCGADPVSCVFTDGNDFKNITNDRAKLIYYLCTQAHESQHVWDFLGGCPECPGSDTEIGSIPWKHKGLDFYQRECRAWHVTIACLRTLIYICYDDMECANQIMKKIEDAKGPLNRACRGSHPYPPNIA